MPIPVGGLSERESPEAESLNILRSFNGSSKQF